MKLATLFIIIFLLSTFGYAQTDSLMLRRIYDEELTNGQCYQNLHYLCKNIGGRLSGSANAQKAVEWGKRLMDGYGFDRVYLQPVMVPHWERGAKEQGYIIDGAKHLPVKLCALGMAIATPAQGITANVIEVHSLKALDSLGSAKINGKIVFFNRPFDPKFIRTLQAYAIAGDQRRAGPSAAAKFGAVGVIVRSLTESIDDYPHTGTTTYTDDAPKIPAAALSTKAADQLSALLKQHPVQFFFKQNCRQLPDAPSFNVVGEIKGSVNPNNFITVGGHLDSWDLAEGAHDDGTGIVQSVEALRLLRQLGYRPKNSMRAVFFINEENGEKGGTEYARLAMQNKENHIAAIESDLGGFTPLGFTFDGLSNTQLSNINSSWKKLLEPYQADHLVPGGSGSDIEPLRAGYPKAALIGFQPDSQRYFDVHHTANDVFENVNKRELELGAAAMASMMYLIDMRGGW